MQTTKTGEGGPGVTRDKSIIVCEKYKKYQNNPNFAKIIKYCIQNIKTELFNRDFSSEKCAGLLPGPGNFVIRGPEQVKHP